MKDMIHAGLKLVRLNTSRIRAMFEALCTIDEESQKPDPETLLLIDQMQLTAEAEILDAAAAFLELEKTEELFVAEKRRTEARIATIRAQAASLKSLIERAVPIGTKLSDQRVQVGWRKSPPSVAVMVEPEALPAQFQRVKVEADRTKIKAALTMGQEVPGCSIEQGHHLRIA